MLSKYPWKRSLKVEVQKLSDIEADKGTGPTLKPVKTEVKTEEDVTDQEPAKLIEHANALIHGMRSLATDPVNKGQSPRSTPKRKKSAVPVETNVPNALE